ncbi:MAG: hypothetical protein P4M14_03135 [Gammaproteobacteria bacterium]|nr:hypothetical protein [Gammaproteobacteria bacterium]
MEYKQRWIAFFKDQNKNPYTGYVSKSIIVNKIRSSNLQLSIFLTYSNDRFHEMSFELPKSEYIQCLEHQDSKYPCVFVKDTWFKKFLETKYCCYGLIDEVDFKETYLINPDLNDYSLKRKSGIEKIANEYPQISFVIFSDSVLLKLPWSLDQYEATYTPELMVGIFKEIKDFYKRKLHCECYGIFIQGVNYTSTNDLISVGKNNNCIDLNCSGSAFANLFSIDATIKLNIKNKQHKKSQIYFDEKFLISLKINPEKKEKLHKYLFPYYSSLYRSYENYVSDAESLVLGETDKKIKRLKKHL